MSDQTYTANVQAIIDMETAPAGDLTAEQFNDRIDRINAMVFALSAEERIAHWEYRAETATRLADAERCERQLRTAREEIAANEELGEIEGPTYTWTGAQRHSSLCRVWAIEGAITETFRMAERGIKTDAGMIPGSLVFDLRRQSGLSRDQIRWGLNIALADGTVKTERLTRLIAGESLLVLDSILTNAGAGDIETIEDYREYLYSIAAERGIEA